MRKNYIAAVLGLSVSVLAGVAFADATGVKSEQATARLAISGEGVDPQSQIQVAYDGSGRPQTPAQVAYDGSGRPQTPAQVAYDGSGRPQTPAQVAYDGSGRPQAQTRAV